MICNTCGNDRRVWGCRCEEVQQIADLRAALAAERKAGDSKQQRIEDVVRELAMVTKRREETQQLWEAERKRVAELERDRERLLIALKDATCRLCRGECAACCIPPKGGI